MSNLLTDRRLLLPLLVTAVIIAVGSVLVIMLTGDAGESSAAPGGRAPGDAQGGGGKTVPIDIADFKYMPETITVKAGGKLSWTNNDSAPHTATSDAFDTGNLDKGDSKIVSAPEPGTYSYVCEFHAFMKGEVVVE